MLQVSLSSKLKKQLSLRSKSGKVYDTQHSYHFIQMKGPKLKGHAEMAVIRRDSSYIEQPGVFTYSDESHSQQSDSHSDGSDSHSNDLDFHSNVFQPSEPNLSAADSQTANSSLTVGAGGTSNQGGSLQGGKYSPKLRQAFLGQSVGASYSVLAERELERDHATPLSPTSPVSRGSCSSETGLISDGGDSNEQIGRSMYSHSDVADYGKRGVVFKEGRGHSRTSEKHNKSSTRSNSQHSAKIKSRGKGEKQLLQPCTCLIFVL